MAAPSPYPAYGQPQPRRRSAWFWIAIIGGCFVSLVPILLIIAAVAIPQMLQAKKAANQAVALETMRAISSAEINYNASANSYACSLSGLNVDPALTASPQHDGYEFAITCGTKATVNGQDVYTSYQLTAVPQIVGKTGDNGYCSDENGIIKVDRTGGVNCTEPLQ